MISKNCLINTGEKLSGIWVQEGFYNSAQYIGEKS